MHSATVINWEHTASPYNGTATYCDSAAFLERAFRATWKDEPVVDTIANAIAESGESISERTIEAANILLSLLWAHPAPEISVDSGEIAFEWYKDRHHVAVLSVDESHIRWAAMKGADNPISGVQIFTHEIPAEALDAIKAAT
jgi:succinyl-CoA synthetase alpha subunit